MLSSATLLVSRFAAAALLSSSLLIACSSSDSTSADDDDTSSSSSSSSGGESSSSGGESSSSSSGSTGSSSSSSSSSDSVPQSSQGTGGIDCESQGALDGDPDPDRRYCLANEGGAEFKFVLPQTSTGPYSLGLYLHGDGAGAYRSNSAMESLLAWADAHNTILVSVRAPNTCSWWLEPEYACPSNNAVNIAEDRDSTHQNATALDAVLKKLRARYDISNGPIFYYGSSGGSVFLTYSFFPKFGNVYPGAFALNCGGEVPEPGTASWDLDDPAQRGSSQMWFTYGGNDPLKVEIEPTVDYFMDLGVPVDENVIVGAGHCVRWPRSRP